MLHDSVQQSSFIHALWGCLLRCPASSMPTQLIWGHICSLNTTGLYLSSTGKTFPALWPISSAHLYLHPPRLCWEVFFCSQHSNCECHSSLQCVATPWGLINTTHCASIWLSVIKQIQEEGGKGRGRQDRKRKGFRQGPLIHVSFIDG